MDYAVRLVSVCRVWIERGEDYSARYGCAAHGLVWHDKDFTLSFGAMMRG